MASEAMMFALDVPPRVMRKIDAIVVMRVEAAKKAPSAVRSASIGRAIVASWC